MSVSRIPKRCRGCASLHTAGKPGTKYARWCTGFGNEAAKVQAQCVQSGARREKEPLSPEMERALRVMWLRERRRRG